MNNTSSLPQGVITTTAVVHQLPIPNGDSKMFIGAGTTNYNIRTNTQVGGNNILLNTPMSRPNQEKRFVTNSCLGYKRDDLPQPVGVSTTKSDGLVTVAIRGKVFVEVHGEPGQCFQVGDRLRVNHPSQLMEKAGVFYPRLVVDNTNQPIADVFDSISQEMAVWLSSNPNMQQMIHSLLNSPYYDYDALGLNKFVPNDDHITKLTAEYIRFIMTTSINFLNSLVENGVCTLTPITNGTTAQNIKESFDMIQKIKYKSTGTDINETNAINKAISAHLTNACKTSPVNIQYITGKSVLDTRGNTSPASAASDTAAKPLDSFPTEAISNPVSGIQQMQKLMDQIRARKDRTILGTAESDLVIPSYQSGQTKAPCGLMVNLHPGQSNTSA